ncbi:MAG: citrate lyase subunit beta, partial [Enterovirga sp.]|nr:citrate lyase subunit beta [Enterovirga sp.]
MPAPHSSTSPFRARSLLFVPGDNERKLQRSETSDANLILIDIEDAVVLERKAAGRDTVAAYGLSHRERTCPLWVRMNPLGGENALLDLAATVHAAPDGYLVPEVRSAADLRVLD